MMGRPRTLCARMACHSQPQLWTLVVSLLLVHRQDQSSHAQQPHSKLHGEELSGMCLRILCSSRSCASSLQSDRSSETILPQ